MTNFQLIQLKVGKEVPEQAAKSVGIIPSEASYPQVQESFEQFGRAKRSVRVNHHQTCHMPFIIEND